MAQMEDLLASVDSYRDEMIKEMGNMLAIPAMGPENGGQGEFERARFIEELVRRCGFTDVQTYQALDERVTLKVRPSVIAKRKGKSKRTVWIISHMDTVSPGDDKAWTYPPFQGTVVEGKLFGRGSEDNGQAVISSLFAARALLDTGRDPDLTVGLAIVADEEAGSDFGIKYLIKEGLFGKDDLFYVPDSGEADGSVIEVAEKSIIWLKIAIKGKQVHASTPEKGINALRVGSEMLLFLADQFAGRFPAKNPLFAPSGSTFEPTKRMANCREHQHHSGRGRHLLRHPASAGVRFPRVRQGRQRGGQVVRAEDRGHHRCGGHPHRLQPARPPEPTARAPRPSARQ